jgi:hypothetical protein
MATPAQKPVTGQDVLQLAKQHVGEKYVFGVLVPKDNSEWPGPWDCAEFVSWLIFQTAGVLYGCDRDFGNPSTADAFTGYFDRDARTLGEIISLDEAARTPGAAILRAPQPGAIGHIVISNGLGGTVEAHSSKDGVIESTLANRRWDMGLKIPEIAYAGGSALALPPPTGTTYRLTIPFMAGEKVKEIQNSLKSAGFSPGVVDGEFGPHTHSAVVAFQISNGLVPDGEVGPVTAQALGIQL